MSTVSSMCNPELPEAFLRRMEAQLGPEYPAYLQSLERPRAAALRLNPRKRGCMAEKLFGEAPVPWEPMGFYCREDARPGLHVYHEAGVYYLQEASAMAPVALLDPQPGEWVCDLCAAPGGKTTQIAGRMDGRGLLLTNEINPGRAKILSRNVERMGISNALVVNEHPALLAKRFAGMFDRVLVDAPCSGEGMFRKEAAAVTAWSPETVAMCARRQQEILGSAAALVRPGGRLVYSTCTFAPEEDELAVEAFCEAHPDFHPETVAAPWFTPAGPGMFRLWPQKLRGEGHFAAVLRRDGEACPERVSRAVSTTNRPWEQFREELELSLPAGRLLSFGQSLYLVPEELPELGGLKVLRPGLELGMGKKDRFEPAHALALWLTGCPREIALDPDGPETAKWLHGDVIPGKEKGWCLVKAGPCTIGWGKGDGSVIKNHYPRGLRR